MPPTATEETMIAEVVSEEEVWEEAVEEVDQVNKVVYSENLNSALQAFAKDELGEDESVIAKLSYYTFNKLTLHIPG